MNCPLIDNERVKTAVENMLYSRKIPHAILIEGDKGLGKTTLAMFLAKAALCESKDIPCGVCESCRLFESGNHPDISVVSAESDKASIPISAVRDIISRAAILPHRASHKVFIIDDANLLSVQAQNALLKTLEEPPKSVIFILTAPARTALLQTIVSRCSVLTLCAPDINVATDYIISKTGKNREDILSALKEARGSIGTAINILHKSKNNSAYLLAKEFIYKLQNGSHYELLTLLFPLEKKRKEALEFYNALEVLVVSIIKECSAPTLIKRYEKLYTQILTHKKLLKNNANLPLLLTSLAAVAKLER